VSVAESGCSMYKCCPTVRGESFDELVARPRTAGMDQDYQDADSKERPA